VAVFEIVAFSDPFLAPLISPHVDEYAHQPRFLVRSSAGNGAGGTRSFEEGFLNEIESVISVRNETPGEAIEAVPVHLEQRRQSVGLTCRQDRALRGPFAHSPLNA